MKNIKNVPNTVFADFQCAICLDSFEAYGEVYVTDPGEDIVCYKCAEESSAHILKRIGNKIDYLKDRIVYLEESKKSIIN